MSTSTMVTTAPAVLERGFSLFEARAFKPKGATTASGPAKFSAGVDFDKTTQSAAIKAILTAQKAAVQQAIDREEWDEDQPGTMAFVDADKAKVKESKDSKKLVTLSTKKPTLEGRYVLSAKSKESRRPDVRYVAIKQGAAGLVPVYEKLPVPTEGMDKEEYDAIKAMWDKMVFAGQNVQLGITFRAYTLDTGAQGVSAQLDSVLILGGGTPIGTVPFADHFNDASKSETMAWLEQHAAAYRIPVIGEQDDAQATVNVSTGEISEPVSLIASESSKPVADVVDDEFGDFDDSPIE